MDGRDGDPGGMLPLISEPEYRCPGDRKPISQAVHLARLASGHVACRQCDQRSDTGSLPKSVVKSLRGRPREPDFLIDADEGIRGRSINELTRERMECFVLAILDLVDRDRLCSTVDAAGSVGPLKVQIGLDSRLDSPDLMVGVVQALQQSAVEIIDVGELSRPAFDFAIDRFRPQIGIYVTGGNRPSGWNGMDLIDSAGLPWLTPERQTEFLQRLDSSVVRLNRTAGRYQVAEILRDYELHLANQFHALRPLRIGVDCPEPGLRRFLQQLLERTPCDPRFLQSGVLYSSERGTKSLADLVCEFHLDLGVSISPDGRGGRFYDETGAELEPSQFVRLFLQQYPDVTEEDRRKSVDLISSSGSERVRRERQRAAKLPVLIDEKRRCCFLGESPECDVFQTFARLLEVMSLSERPLSWIANNR